VRQRTKEKGVRESIWIDVNSLLNTTSTSPTQHPLTSGLTLSKLEGQSLTAGPPYSRPPKLEAMQICTSTMVRPAVAPPSHRQPTEFSGVLSLLQPQD